MSDSGAALRGRIASAIDLQSMARTMKSIAASNIGQYEAAARALDAYYAVVQDSLGLCLRATRGSTQLPITTGPAGAIVFGSDQGLVGQFNEAVCAAVHATGRAYQVLWPVGERTAAVLTDGPGTLAPFPLPASIDAVTALVGRLLVAVEASGVTHVDVFHHRPDGASGYVALCEHLLPLDAEWQGALMARPWPTNALAQVLPRGDATLRACIREYLFVSLFRACALSLASENAARLAAMQRAEKNIGENLQALTLTFHRQRQGAIDDELFDLVAGFEAQQASAARANITPS
jgi:F-type H+-transporting ATPase subunit gamma